MRILPIITLLMFHLSLISQSAEYGSFGLCCKTPNEYQTITVNKPCIQAIINADGTIAYQNPNAEFEITTSSVSSGTGNNNNGGNRYQLIFPNGLPLQKYPIVTAIDGLLPNALILGNIEYSGNSMTYGFYSGDDGQGVDDARRTQHHIKIEGCSESFEILIDNQ